MKGDMLIDYGLLAILTVLELTVYVYFLNKVERRFSRRSSYAFLTLATGALLFFWLVQTMTEKNIRNVYGYTYTLQHYLTLALWIYVTLQLKLRETIYYTALLFLATRGLFHGLGHLSIILFDTNYLTDGTIWPLRLFSCLVLALLYRGSLGIVKHFCVYQRQKGISGAYLLLVTCAIIPCFYSGSWSKTLGLTDARYGFDAILVEIIASVCGLVCILSYEWMSRVQRQEGELRSMEAMLQLQYRQYETRKETIELINRKYHDMKKTLTYLEQLSDEEEKRQSIHSLREELKGYETLFQTGNETLDLVLYDKTSLCQKEGIPLVLLLDESSLAFFRPMDIAAIFGNALDNAIEQARLMTGEKREISLRISSRPGWLMFRFENYCEEDALRREEDGQLQTTKGDENTHGYGLRSIRYAAQKYEGNMTIDVREGKFALNLMFPVSQEPC